MEKKWQVKLSVQKGDQLSEGQIFAVTQETPVIEHRAMVPPGLSGEVVSVVPEGEYTVNDALVVLKDKNGKEQELRLAQKWPIKVRRPVAERLPVDRPLITGQRVIDTLFPMAKGGTAAVPGGFGAGKTMTQHQLAKWRPDRLDRQYFQYACGRPGSFCLYRDYAGGILPGYGVPCGSYGRFHFPLGGSIAGNFRTFGRNACRGRLSGLFAQPDFPVLRTGWIHENPLRKRRFRFHYWGCFAPGRGFFRTGYPEYKTVCPVFLGAG